MPKQLTCNLLDLKILHHHSSKQQSYSKFTQNLKMLPLPRKVLSHKMKRNRNFLRYNSVIITKIELFRNQRMKYTALLLRNGPQLMLQHLNLIQLMSKKLRKGPKFQQKTNKTFAYYQHHYHSMNLLPSNQLLPRNR